MEQRIGFLPTPEDGRIAYSLLGSGPPLLCDTGWIHHLEAFWSFPAYRRFFETLAASHTVIRFDRPGCGLSDREPGELSLERDLRVMERLAGHLKLDRVRLFGASQAGAPLVAYAARFPERVERMVLFGVFADGDRLCPDDLKASLLALVRAHWGVASETMTDIFLHGGDRAAAEWFAAAQRAAADAETAAGMLAQCYHTDVTALLGQVRAPALVLHRRGDRSVPFALGRELAAGIPGARFVQLEGRSHLFYVGDLDSVLEPTLGFLGAGRPPAAPHLLTERELAVARLVAGGLSNAEIAARLGIAQRTAESHVEHIRNKLGFNSRAQVAGWVGRYLEADSGVGSAPR